MGKVINLIDLISVLKDFKKNNKKIVTTNGCFDILHVGHVRYLAEARSLGDVLIVGLNSDDSVRRLKGPTRPINSENDRAEVLASLISVDYVVLFNEDTPVELLSQIKPNIHAKGGDYNPDTLPESKIVQENDGKLVFIQFIEGKSTTGIIEKAKI